MGREFMETDAASELESVLADRQARVQEQIRQIYPELEVRFSYTLLTNGFSCALPENLIAAAASLPDVVSVARVQESFVPQMSHAAAIGGIPAFRNETGCTGEGQVIAVIDSELDVTHPMFSALPDDIETKLDKDTVTEIIQSGGLHMEIDPDRAYLSSKLPFVIDYASDNDPYEDIADEHSYHGTHVSGIAAGNEFEMNDGTVISGVAKDAQIIFFACGVHGRYIEDDAAAAALEDAVRLHADVINMSFGTTGENYGDDMLSDLMLAAERAGVTICSSAGNADCGKSFGRSLTPDMPDVSTLDVKAGKESCSMLVASADNTYTAHRGILKFGDTPIVYRPVITLNGYTNYLTDSLELGDYEYVDCGLGINRFPDLTGKLALVQMSNIYPESFAEDAMNANAAGLILIEPQEEASRYMVIDTDFPTALISYQEGQMLLNAENRILTYDGTYADDPYDLRISEYSSWGVPQSLDLRPDITGIGGNVVSAAYGEQTEVLSGTSMSSPYLCGCAAIVRQYLEKQGNRAEGLEKVSLVRNLLMNTAVPLEEDGMYVRPRQQGAGLAALDQLANDKVLVTGAGGAAKVNLYDGIADSFTFDIHLDNFSDENVSFGNARLVLTTDKTAEDSATGSVLISGQQALNCEADLSGLLQIAAGESRTETVSVSLDAAQCAEIGRVFCNGFFVEGYLLLEDAENCCDISVPLLGFRGDWAQLPILDAFSVFTDNLDCMTPAGLSLSQGMRIVQSIMERAAHTEDYEKMDEELSYWIYELGTEEERSLLEHGSDDIWLSPNGDGFCDYLRGVYFNNKRQAKCTLEILDEEGTLISTNAEVLPPAGIKNKFYERYTGIYANPDLDPLELKPGTYICRCSFAIDYPGAAEHPTVIERVFHVDDTAPQLSSEVIEQKGRKILRLTAYDDYALDSVFVVGNGKGYLADGNANEFAASPLKMVNAMSVLRELSSPVMKRNELSEDAPLVLRILTERDKRNPDFIFDFSDMIYAEPQKDGTFTFEYDITDLTDYTFTVMDKAYNYSVFSGTESSISEMPAGIWQCPEEDGIFEFTAGSHTVRFASFRTGEITEYAYDLTDYMLTLTNGNETVVRRVRFLNNEEIMLTDPEAEMHPQPYTMTRASSLPPLDELEFHSVEDCLERLIPLYEELSGWKIVDYEYVGGYIQCASLILIADDGNRAYMTLTLTYGIAVGDYVGSVYLFDEQLTEPPQGTYFCPEGSVFVVFAADGRSGSFLTRNGYNWLNLGFSTPFTYTVAENGDLMISYYGKEQRFSMKQIPGSDDFRFGLRGGDSLRMIRYSDVTDTDPYFLTFDQAEDLCAAYYKGVTGRNAENVSASFDADGNFFVQIPYFSYLHINPFTGKGRDDHGNAIDLNSIPEMLENIYDADVIEEMAAQDYLQRFGTESDYVETMLYLDGSYTVSFRNRDSEEEVLYTLDAVTAKGTDNTGEQINLPQTGNNAPGTAAVTVCALLLLMAGAGLLYRSRRLSRKHI